MPQPKRVSIRTPPKWSLGSNAQHLLEVDGKRKAGSAPRPITPMNASTSAWAGGAPSSVGCLRQDPTPEKE